MSGPHGLKNELPGCRGIRHPSGMTDRRGFSLRASSRRLLSLNYLGIAKLSLGVLESQWSRAPHQQGLGLGTKRRRSVRRTRQKRETEQDREKERDRKIDTIDARSTRRSAAPSSCGPQSSIGVVLASVDWGFYMSNPTINLTPGSLTQQRHMCFLEE